ncbi:unnamed protein product, partial [Ixodes pacificus]
MDGLEKTVRDFQLKTKKEESQRSPIWRRSRTMILSRLWRVPPYLRGVSRCC